MSKSMCIPPDVILWGEISEEKRNIIGDDLLRTLIRGAEKQEGPKLKLPVAANDDESVNCDLPDSLTVQNEYVMHTIRLNNHAKAVEEMIERAEAGITVFEPCPLVPKLNSSKIKTETDDKSKVLNFVLGQGTEFPSLDNTTINAMLQKAVFVTLAETGFDKAKKSSVLVLIDVIRYFLTKICKLLHMFSQPDVMKGRSTFKDPLEKVLQLLGMSGIKELHTFYLKNVIGKSDLALKRSIMLENRYNSIVNKMNEQADMEADESNLAEIDLVETVTIKQEPGFQMLLDFKSEPQPGCSTSQDISSSSLAKSIIKKRITSNSLHKKQKLDY